MRGDPFLFADWERVVFLHFAVAAETLKSYLPPSLELELHDRNACVSLVALTMQRFRPAQRFSAAWALRPIPRQQFLNVRTYVRHHDEPGAFFLWGWLSNPLPIAPPLFDLPCAFGRMDYRHDYETKQIRGVVTAGSQRFSYRASFPPRSSFDCCSTGSLAEFALERYTGFFTHKHSTKIFRAWHPPWLQTSIDAEIEDAELLTSKFDWFKEAKFVGANFAPGFKQVSLGRMRPLKNVSCKIRERRHGTSAFYEMP